MHTRPVVGSVVFFLKLTSHNIITVDENEQFFLLEVLIGKLFFIFFIYIAAKM